MIPSTELVNESDAFHSLKDRLLEMVGHPSVPAGIVLESGIGGYRVGCLDFFQKVLPMLFDYHGRVREIIGCLDSPRKGG